MELDQLFEAYSKAILYIAIREGNSKKHSPYNFREGYTTLMNASLFSVDRLDGLKCKVIDCVDAAKGNYSMQIMNIKTGKVVFKYSNF